MEVPEEKLQELHMLRICTWVWDHSIMNLLRKMLAQDIIEEPSTCLNTIPASRRQIVEINFLKHLFGVENNHIGDQFTDEQLDAFTTQLQLMVNAEVQLGEGMRGLAQVWQQVENQKKVIFVSSIIRHMPLPVSYLIGSQTRKLDDAGNVGQLQWIRQIRNATVHGRGGAEDVKKFLSIYEEFILKFPFAKYFPQQAMEMKKEFLAELKSIRELHHDEERCVSLEQELEEERAKEATNLEKEKEDIKQKYENDWKDLYKDKEEAEQGQSLLQQDLREKEDEIAELQRKLEDAKKEKHILQSHFDLLTNGQAMPSGAGLQFRENA